MQDVVLEVEQVSSGPLDVVSQIDCRNDHRRHSRAARRVRRGETAKVKTSPGAQGLVWFGLEPHNDLPTQGFA